MKNYEILQASGNLEIVKIYNNGNEEIIFSDHNTITSGLGVSLATVFVGSGSDNIKDHQIRWFQLGSGAGSYDSTQNKLYNPISDSAIYGAISTDSHEIAKHDGGNYGTQVFAWIPQSSFRKTSSTSITYLLDIDHNSCNGVNLTEIGLFVHSPFRKFTGSSVPRSVLAAYRQFNTVVKTDEFSLLFRWTLSF